jgi:hypothetical protein
MRILFLLLERSWEVRIYFEMHCGMDSIGVQAYLVMVLWLGMY